MREAFFYSETMHERSQETAEAAFSLRSRLGASFSCPEHGSPAAEKSKTPFQFRKARLHLFSKFWRIRDFLKALETEVSSMGRWSECATQASCGQGGTKTIIPDMVSPNFFWTWAWVPTHPPPYINHSRWTNSAFIINTR